MRTTKKHSNIDIEHALEESYSILKPYSDTYNVDKKRFLYSLFLLEEFGVLNGSKKILDIGCPT